MSSFGQKLLRRKFVDLSSVTNTQLARCLTTLDLTALGIGSTLGAGIYVVAGQVAKEKAGPAVTISFLIAALASVLAGLCYAEFGARVPKTGSAYVYSYVTVGEFVAFIIGWNLILEYVIGTASVARAWSSYFDSLVDKVIQNFFKDNMPMDIPGFSSYPDFFALGITLLLAVILAVGVKESSTFNNIFTGVNLLVVTYVIICGFFKVDIHNWQLKPSELPGNGTDSGSGGFMPFGFSGMMSGAATCFYAFVGFDCIATTGEEVKNPQKAIPISIVISLIAIFVAYFGISAVMTLMCPYYLLDEDAPLPDVFDRVGWGVARYIIAVGAICGLSTSLLGAMFPLPRVIYAMASDGIVFRSLATINERFKTPLIATIISGIFAGVMAMMFDLSELVDMMSIGTLLAYTLVGVCVLLLRYRVTVMKTTSDADDSSINHSSSDDCDVISPKRSPIHESDPLVGDTSYKVWLKAMIRCEESQPTALTEKLAQFNVILICMIIIVLSFVLIFAEENLANTEGWAITIVAVLVLSIIFLLYSIRIQPENTQKVSFKVPLLPVLPVLSVFVNIYLMLKLSSATWIRFGVWMFLGFLIYFSYGIWHSTGSEPNLEEYVLLADTPTPSSPSSDLLSGSDDSLFDGETVRRSRDKDVEKTASLPDTKK
ncbi:high affinity cationic amino acid transporter 1-like isoform X1 [Pecten maximus]|uniref:high affinity cationic amino acid transporter 1-like isoform X1 n=1 Tax=Pecten maximus TaxID=6579 RepID=UPI0014588D86|nr:high affinity cationic amino acid transporter 1-like isoform X1 [Pecten maximus]